MSRPIAIGVIALVVGVAVPAAPQAAVPQTRAGTGTLELEIAETPAQHRAMAKDYRRRAASYVLDAQMHRQLRDVYRQGSSAKASRDAGGAWWRQARAHCDRMAADAERLAREADAMAALHDEQARAIEARQDAGPEPRRER